MEKRRVLAAFPLQGSTSASMAKKRRVPDVLWRVYRDRARTLAETILHLLPPEPPKQCHCKGRGCLGCSGADATSFLLRPHDPSDYKTLLTKCFVVLPENAQHHLSVFYITRSRRRSQREIVRRTVEMIMCDEKMTGLNVIHNGYNKLTRSSSVVDLLTTSAWSLLLSRIGDEAMVHLLKFAAIFLPLPRENHHQVAGFPMSDLCSSLSEHVSGYQPPLSIQTETAKKRKRVKEYSFGSDYISAHQMDSKRSLVSVTCGGGGGGDHMNHVGCHWLQQRGCSQIRSNENMRNTCNAINDDKKTLNGKLQERLSEARKNSKKRARPFSWQRYRKRRQANCITASEDTQIASCNLQNKATINLESPAEVVLMQESEKQHKFITHSEKTKAQCFCVLMLRAQEMILHGEEINRKSMFYQSDISSSLFPEGHILNQLKPNDIGAITLANHIFGSSLVNLNFKCVPFYKHICGFCLNGSVCLYHLILELLKSLIGRALGCQYSKLLDKHCTTATSVEFATGETGFMANQLLEVNHPRFQKIAQQRYHQKNMRASNHQHNPSMSYCQKNQVVSFIWAVCRSIVPSDFLGTPSNWRVLRRNISMFIQLRRFEIFSLKQCMHGLKMSSIPLLSNMQCSCYLSNHSLVKGEDMQMGCTKFRENVSLLKKKLFSCWIYWFFSCLVVPIVQANFYVTESEVGKLEMFYYRKPVWEKLTSRTITCLRERSYHLLDDTSFWNILRKRYFGFSRVRFCPKENGIRALANLKAPSKVSIRKPVTALQFRYKEHSNIMQRRLQEFKYFKSVNSVLHNLSSVLKGIKVKHPDKLGSSVFDYNDVYEKLSSFVIGLRNGSTMIPSVFVVICDVSKAFDSVDQDKLLSVMKDVMSSDEYLIKWSAEVVCTKEFVRVHDVCMLDQNLSFATRESSTSGSGHSSHIVRINKVTQKKISKVELYNDLCEHVKFNVLQMGQNWYLQKVGICQGSALSSLLCSFYYGHLENNVILPYLEKIPRHQTLKAKRDLAGRYICQDIDLAEGNLKDAFSTSPTHLLLRLIDDFLFISTSKKQAASFFCRLQRGFREYNCFINESKSCLNFDVDHTSGIFSKRMYTGDDSVSFLPWSGLLINSCTLEIQADYTRYLDIHLSSTLTVCWQDKPVHYFKERLCHYMRPKCHPIFYDSNINSDATVRLNVYQAFLLCAMKFHCYFCCLSRTCTVDEEHYFKMIISCVRYLHKLIKRRMCPNNFGPNVRPVLRLREQEVVWLGLTAFVRVLKRKSSRHSRLLSLLRSELSVAQVVWSAPLKYAVDDSHSSVFWKIKY